MARPRNAVPVLRHRKITGEWYYFAGGKRHLLGKDKKVAEQRHRAAMLARVDLDGPPAPGTGITIAEGTALFLRAEGPRWDQRDYARNALALSSLFGMLPPIPAAELRFADLERWTKAMLLRPSSKHEGEPISRQYVAKLLGAIRHCWRWLALRDHVPAEAAHRVSLAVRECKRIKGRDTAPRRPVPEADVRATIKHLRPELADMLRVQLATGMRTGELLRMNADEIDRTGAAWVYSPVKHKNAHRHKVRRVRIPEALKAVLTPYLSRGKLWTIGQSGYVQAIEKACRAAGLKPWAPYALRHTAATEARAEGGDAAAVLILDHVGKSLLERYTGTVEDVRARKAG